jgi:FkbM family methyltransferase
VFDRNAASAELTEMFSEGLSAATERESSEFDRAVDDARGRIVLFGAGTLGRQALASVRRDGLEPLAFSDNSPNAWGKTIDDLTVLSPNEAADRFGNSSAFLVTIWNDRQRFAETATRLESLGCSRVLASPALRWKYRSDIPPFPFFFLDLPHLLYSAVPRISAAANVWADDQSRREYLAQIRLRLFGELKTLPPPEPNQYAPFDLFAPTDQEVFVDCGAFDGDTIREFAAAWDGRFNRIYALEPDPGSCRRLLTSVQLLPPSFANRIDVLPIAVGGESGQVRFRADGSMGAAFADDGDIMIECRTLDDVFEDEPVSYIKMDIEGQELAALRGGMGVIARCRPVIAVCVYHTQNHLWAIPLFLHERLKNYSFFLRPHKPDGWDLIVYAVPRERLRKNPS